MNWVAASLLSALFLGFYELCTKHAVRANSVVPVLFFSTLTAAVIWLALLALEALCPGRFPAALVPDTLTWTQHGQLILKSMLVASSWIFTYLAVKHLPLSLGSPIRATSPLWTLAGALLILGERPSALELLGVVTTLVSFMGLSLAGAREGVHFLRNKWVGFIVAGTLLGAVSALYDKYLLARQHFSVPTVQAWFSIYMCLCFLPLAIAWRARWWPQGPFHWRWSIPLIALALLVSDYIYFSALHDPASLVSLVMSLRRGSTLVAFAGGLLFFGEHNGWQKLPAVLGILVGILLTMLG